MQISVKGDVKEALRHLRFVRAEQIPYATKLAIDDVLKQAAPAVKAHMSSELDKPTPWTLNSFRILKWAKKNDPTGIIGFKDMGYKGGPSGKAGSAAGSYLQPLMSGTTRPAKRLEGLLRAKGLIGSNEFVVPSKAQKLDQYGNVSRGAIQKIIANLKISFDPHTNTPTGGARGGKKKAEYYFTRRGICGQTITAIWHRYQGGRASPAFIVVSGAPKYRKQLDIPKIVDTSVRKNFPAAFARAYAQAARTAR